MKKSARALRMDRRHRRSKMVSKLNLVSLMDIFTILVFFLLTNSDEVETLQRNNDIKLPETVSDQKPDTTLTVTLTDQAILVNTRLVARLKDIEGESGNIAGLENELKYQAERAGPLTAAQEARGGRAVTILGDANSQYTVIKRILNTCVSAGYVNTSLAGTQIAKETLPPAES